MPLNDLFIKNVKPIEKAYKLTDEKGLFLLVHPNGSKYWRFKYYFAGKEKCLALGVYPEIKLAEAREKRDQARKLLKENLDPTIIKKTSKQALLIAAENSFENVACEWHLKFISTWTQKHGERIMDSLAKRYFSMDRQTKYQ